MSKNRKIFRGKEKVINSELFKIEDGKLVPTAQYLLKKGKCCGESCKYCPYENNNSKA